MSDNINSLLLELVKKSIISSQDAVLLKKIHRTIERYDTYNSLENAEDEYYSSFSCYTKLDRIMLETKYLESKLHKIYNDSLANGEQRTKITFAILKLKDLTETVKTCRDDHSLDDFIKQIIMLEAEFDIELKFLSEAYNYLQSKILILTNGESKNG